ncbi:MAG: ribulose-phosphate 3-epimerase [Prolixibacteraceae bacterium]|jgi:ribulose-phosphate 3-epimerase|nr:ribulose-phosphate 3-epimerase [Prolixibacteraceae bacterium]
MTYIAPSILSADFNQLGKDIMMINESEADFIHCDIMDGVFVPNISFGIPIVEHVKRIATKPLDVHLMIIDPDKYIEEFSKAGASWLTVHYETCPHLHRTVNYIKEQGVKASVCLNPHTPVSVLENIISEIDMVLLMSVNPGFGGQEFIPLTVRKVKELKKMIRDYNPGCLIEVDGGVNYETGKMLIDAGTDVLVAGSFVFKSDDPADTIARLKRM